MNTAGRAHIRMNTSSRGPLGGMPRRGSRRPVLRRISVALVAAAVAILSACSAKPHVVQPEFSADGGICPKTIYIVNHGWHTGVLFPGPDMNAEIPRLRDRFGDVAYFEFGWGDEGFYRARRVTSGLAVRALFWPTDAVLHVVAVPGLPKEYFSGSEVVEISVRTEGVESLKKFILQSFARDAGGDISPLEPGIYGESQFYRAVGKYFFLNTCNTWTAKAVKSSGKDISAAFKLTPGSVMNGLDRSDAPEPKAP